MVTEFWYQKATLWIMKVISGIVLALNIGMCSFRKKTKRKKLLTDADFQSKAEHFTFLFL